jgi:hypothetical protein
MSNNFSKEIEIRCKKMENDLKDSDHWCEVSDSFVHPNNKLSGGKKGHGEARLFISNNKYIGKRLSNKPWKIEFDKNYLTDIKNIVNDQTNFIKEREYRYKEMENAIKEIDNKIIQIKDQNGKNDVNRYYIGAMKDDEENKRKWTNFRKALLPQKTTLVFKEDKDFILVIIKYCFKKSYNTLNGDSFASREYFVYLEEKLGIEIQTARTREFSLRKENGYNWPVDGYHNCNSHKCSGNEKNPCKYNNTVWEFQGSYWHKDKTEKDIEKKNFYEKQGYTMIWMMEDDWNKIKKMKN